MKKLIYILVLTFLFISCDQEQEKVIFDSKNGQTFVSFQGTSADLPIFIDDVGSVDIPINITTVSNTDRTFNVSVVPELTTANPASYSLGSITIPADSFTGTLTINGTDVGVETTPETLVLQIEEEGGIAAGATFTVNIFQICPVDETFFTGMYLMEQLSGADPFYASEVFGDTQIVEITANGTNRSFNFVYFPGIFDSDYNFTMNLVCNEIQVSGTINPGNGTLGCDGVSSIEFGTGNPISTYTQGEVEDDIMLVNVTDFAVANECGVSPYQVELRFTEQ